MYYFRRKSDQSIVTYESTNHPMAFYSLKTALEEAEENNWEIVEFKEITRKDTWTTKQAYLNLAIRFIFFVMLWFAVWTNQHALIVIALFYTIYEFQREFEKKKIL